MLAELAVRAGHDVVALDRFGDLDLQRLCPSVSVLRDLGGRGGMEALVDAAEEIHAPSVIYGAGLENQPVLVARLASGRTLLGCPPETLERVRDPVALGASLRAGGLAYPTTFAGRDARRLADRSRRWLRKPVRGGGGRGVREWRGGALDGDVVVQQRISGLACSVAAVADGRSAVVLGVSEQLIGHRGFGARGYAWCGNLVPPRLGEAERRALAGAARTICAHLALAFGLRGLFGVDLVWDGERAWVVEVNPRPTGSLECVEAAHEVGVFAAHLDGCAGRLPSTAPARGAAPGGRQGDPLRHARTCASGTPAAGRRAASATCLTRASGSPPVTRSAPSSRFRSPPMPFSPTSRRAPPRSAPSLASAPGSVPTPDSATARPRTLCSRRIVTLSLNDRAQDLADRLAAEAEALRVAVTTLPGGTRLIDCGSAVLGGLEPGRRFAEICMAGLGSVSFAPLVLEGRWLPGLTVVTDRPALACLASQYAGWRLDRDDYFAMASGPGRALIRAEELYDDLEVDERAQTAVLCLETRERAAGAGRRLRGRTGRRDAPRI